ncbi:MAG: hypothetical protein ACLU9S_16200 [Oscillospiraceae bacterium]
MATIARCTKEAAKFENYMSDVVKVVDGMADATGKVSNKMAENGRTLCGKLRHLGRTAERPEYADTVHL